MKEKTCICKYTNVCQYTCNEDECKIEPEFRTFHMNRIMNMTWEQIVSKQGNRRRSLII